MDSMQKAAVMAAILGGAGGSPHGGIGEMLQEVRERRAIKEKLKAGMLANGYTMEDYRMFGTLHASLEEYATALAAVCAIAENTGHVPSAKLTVEMIDYLRGTTRFLYNAINKSDLKPRDLGLKDNSTELLAELDDKQHEMERVLAAAKQADELVKSVQQAG